MVDTKVTKKKTATPKKTSAPVKRKAPVTESEASTGIITNVANSRETPASTCAPPELINQIQPETLASIDVTNPIETFTIPNDTLTDANFAAPGTQHGRLPTPDMPRGAEEGLSLPSTPVSKRRRKTKTDGVSPAKTVPFTPTPSGVGLIAGPENIARKPKNRAKTKNADHMLDGLASINRPAAPDVTNAPVLTSNGSQVVINDSPARKRKAADLPPDVGSPHKPANSTTETLLKDAEAYLVKVDETEKLVKLIENQRCKLFSPEGLSEAVDPFTALASGIMGQQVSGAAAASIRKKFTALFSDTHPAFPSPSAVLTKDIPTLRTAGLSQRKAEYITGLAEKFASGEFTAEGLVSASDEELIEKLVAVRGLGRWSVEMFACFGLKRMDVFSTGDLGVQ
ncbi:3-methyladenine DNA glycosylase [Nothophoma quercina]|uniref:3-methyladenine DNA glycosylase n=1 Tax=Nothophoma quercina TaxID=749835 RepID=A0ABR3QZ74_9PLEO